MSQVRGTCKCKLNYMQEILCFNFSCDVPYWQIIYKMLMLTYMYM